jgi:hypothetical protein
MDPKQISEGCIDMLHVPNHVRRSINHNDPTRNKQMKITSNGMIQTLAGKRYLYNMSLTAKDRSTLHDVIRNYIICMM